MKKVRQLDKLVDELAKGRAMEKIKKVDRIGLHKSVEALIKGVPLFVVMGLVHGTIIKTGHPKVRTNMRRIAILLITAFFLQLTGCSPKDHVMDGDGMVRSYSQISQEEAKQMILNKSQRSLTRSKALL